jgi:hypothetical protein
VVAVLRFQFGRPISSAAQRDEELQSDAALVLRLERAADIAEGTCLAPEDVPEGACVYPIQRDRLGDEHIGQDGEVQIVFDGFQRGAPFRVGSYIGLFLLQ